jgi:uracil-DNA glycosylase family 4
VDAKDLLRRYLEQRRELGESELVLDGLHVEDVMRLLGAAGKPATGAPQRTIRELAPFSAQDWRTSLRDAGVNVEPPISTAAASTGRVPFADTEIESPPNTIDAAIESPPPPVEIPDDMAFKKGIVITPTEAELIPSAIEKLRTLEEIAEKVGKCTRCDLYKTATKAVPGEGDPKAELVCVGEAPGAKEDETGRPFVGQAGQLLTKILAAIDLTREQVFICNVLKHRPPGNRNPLPEEVDACSPYLIRQLELIKPKVIVAFGTFAAQTLLQTRTPLGQLRGLVHRYHGIPLIVTYHPAALLRNPAWKRPTWEDVKLARRILDSASRS